MQQKNFHAEQRLLPNREVACRLVVSQRPSIYGSRPPRTFGGSHLDRYTVWTFSHKCGKGKCREFKHPWLQVTCKLFTPLCPHSDGNELSEDMPYRCDGPRCAGIVFITPGARHSPLRRFP